MATHGGAGMILKQNMTPEVEQHYRQELAEARGAGYEILKQGGSALDAAERVIMMMEDSPLFNAGKGSVLTSEGVVEMDADEIDGYSSCVYACT
jgi:beta-aspartyl-peptidase (threonine type)